MRMKNDLMRELECPVCHNSMIPPIFICEKSHNICSNCRPELEKCPKCQKPFTESRNVALENLSLNMHYPCDYREFGCVELLPMEQITSHKVTCPHRPHSCPLAKVPKVVCPWEGPPSEIQNHVLQIHENYVDKSTTGASKPTQLSNVTDNFKDYKVVFNKDKVFLRQIEVKDDNFYCVMMLTGPKELAEEFTYEVKMSSENKAVIVSNVTCSNEENLDEIYESGRCTSLNYNVIKNFMNDQNELNLEIDFASPESKCCVVM